MSAAQPSFEELARAVDEAAARVHALGEAVREPAEDLARAVEAVHRAGLLAIVRRLRADPAGRALLASMADEPVVRLLLSLHGVIQAEPASAQPARPQTALVPAGAVARRPVAGAVARRPVAGARAPDAHVPDASGGRAPGFGPAGPARPEPGWIRARPVAEIADGGITSMVLTTADGAEEDVLVINLGGHLTAYRNACAHHGLPLGGALIDPVARTLTCPWHGLSYDVPSGQCLGRPGTRLEPLPLRVHAGDVWIRMAG